MKRISFCLLFICLSCHKEKDVSNFTREEFIGNYCGIIYSYQPGSYGTGECTSTILRSETHNNIVILDQFIEGESIQGIVEGYNLIIPEDTIKGLWHSQGPGHGIIYYDLSVSGSGFLDTNNYLLHIELREIEIYESGYRDTSYADIKMFNSSKYLYLGNFSGEGATVVISPDNDSLILSMAFSEDWIINGWRNIGALESPCSIDFFVDSIEDISTHDLYEISGSGYKLGDSLRFKIFATNLSTTEWDIFNFTVIKDH
jgi:hypothetical protein